MYTYDKKHTDKTEITETNLTDRLIDIQTERQKEKKHIKLTDTYKYKQKDDTKEAVIK